MKFYFIIIITTLTFFGCEKDTKKTEGNFTYFGGEVINPINDVVILSYSDIVIDTLKLNSKNRFLHKFEDFKSGLYSFSLQSSVTLEYQTILLESMKNDKKRIGKDLTIIIPIDDDIRAVKVDDLTLEEFNLTYDSLINKLSL